MPRIFLSHSHRDKPLARRIARDLRRAGAEVWFDEWNMRVGDSIAREIQRGLASADFVAVLFTRHSVESGWVEKEWQARLGEEAATKKVILLPLKGDDCTLPVILRDRRYADFSRDYQRAIDEVIVSTSPAEAGTGYIAMLGSTGTDSRVPAPWLRLRVLRGEATNGDFRLRQRQILIGRWKECDVRFEKESKISGEHAEISYEAAAFRLRDLGSKNGTFVLKGRDDQAPPLAVDLRGVTLDSGDRILLASVAELELIVDETSEPAETVAPRPEP